MQLRTRLVATTVAAIPLLALVASPATTLAADPPVTLRFAIADEEGRPSDPYVRALVQEVALHSGGSVTLDPTWGAGGDDFEQGVARMLVAGDADIALAAGRGWANAGVSSLDALQAPFLITDDALAAAVATSPTATAMLDGMAGGGALGLALWPEDLRHPVAFEPCIAPITAPDQLQGKTVRAIASGVTFELLTALGATQTSVNGYDELVAGCEIQAAESGLRQGSSLPGMPTFTGDATFFPKFQVLAVSAAAFDQLTPAQQTAVREAATAVRDQALAEHPSEADAAAAWCADGGRVVLAGPDAVAAFQAAAQSVFDRMAADPVSGPAIEAIRALAATVTPAPGAQACAPAPVPSPSTAWVFDPTGFTGDPIPNGTYRAKLTKDDLLAAGASRDFANANWGTKTFTFTDDEARLDQGEQGGPPCAGPMTANGDVVEVTGSTGGCGIDAQYVWRVVDGGIEMAVVPSPVLTDRDYLDYQAFMHRTWTKVD